MKATPKTETGNGEIYDGKRRAGRILRQAVEGGGTFATIDRPRARRSITSNPPQRSTLCAPRTALFARNSLVDGWHS
jgi:hypothetical protein